MRLIIYLLAFASRESYTVLYNTYHIGQAPLKISCLTTIIEISYVIKKNRNSTSDTALKTFYSWPDIEILSGLVSLHTCLTTVARLEANGK